MRLLVTRAADDADRTRAALEAKGHEVIVSPLIEIAGTGAVWPGGAVDALVATSAQAFAFPPDLPVAQKEILPLILVGQRTREAARVQGFAGPVSCAPDVATLVGLLGNASGEPRRLVYWAGRDRKPDLEAAFAERRDKFEIVEAYLARAKPGFDREAASALAAGTVDAVLHFSRRSAVLFRDACRAAAVDANAPRHLCLSADVAAPLHEAGFVRVKTAKAPNEAALFFLLDE